jgi:hypothetical protein
MGRKERKRRPNEQKQKKWKERKKDSNLKDGKERKT